MGRGGSSRGGRGGRGGGGSGGGPRGRGRGRGGYNAFNGAGFDELLLGAAAGQGAGSRGAYRGGGGSANGRGGSGGDGRGAGRGRGRGRGGVLSVRGQNAVSFQYASSTRVLNDDEAMPSEYLHGGVRQTQAVDDEGSDDDDDDDGDVIIEPHKKYRHQIKPHLEKYGSIPENKQRSNELEELVRLPPSVSDLTARSTSNLMAMERAQRAAEGHVARLIPTGPRSAHIHRAFNTHGAIREPLPTSTPSADPSAKKPKWIRPAESLDKDPCLAGIPNRNNGANKWRSGDPAARLHRPLQTAVAFVKASGEWKDGAWVTKDGERKEEPKEAATDVFNRPSGAGLGFVQQKQHAQTEPKLDGQDNATEDSKMEAAAEVEDPLQALLKAYPGSEQVTSTDDGVDPWLQGYYTGHEDINRMAMEEERRQMGFVSTRAATAASTPEMPAHASSDDEEEEILIPRTSTVIASNGKTQTTESDSEEERQLDEILRQEAEARAEAIVDASNGQSQGHDTTPEEVEASEQVGAEKIEEEDGFFVDLTGDDNALLTEASVSKTTTANDGEDIVMYETHTQIIGEDAPQPAEDAFEDEENDEQVPTRRSRNAKAAGPSSKRLNKKRRSASGKIGLGAPKAQRRIPRNDDSDIEWGSDGPPGREDGEEDGEAPDVGQLTLGDESVKAPKARKLSAREAILQDYMENAMNRVDSDDEESEKREESRANEPSDMDAMLAFMRGMDGNDKGQHITIDDIEIENRMREEEEWMTESDEEEIGGEASPGSKDDKHQQDGEDDVNSSDSEESSEEDDEEDEEFDREERKQINEDDDDDEDSGSLDSDEEEGEIFDRNFSWADDDEAFIRKIEKFAQENDEILHGRDRKERKRLLKVMEQGDFGDEDMVLDIDEEDLLGTRPAVRGKDKGKTWKDDNPWAAELQGQWEKDRGKKAANKKKRQAERQAAAMDPFHATHGLVVSGGGMGGKKGRGKKAAKKAARQEARAARRTGRGNFDDDDEDEDEDGEGLGWSDPLSRHAANLVELDVQIRQFLAEEGKSTLSLAPMDKRARAQVHELASAYHLTSKSIGSGKNRFPTLIKNSKSSYGVYNERKIRRILASAGGSFGGDYSRKGGRKGTSGYSKDTDAGWARAKTLAASKVSMPRNQEGADVGFGAERIGEDNVGHRLLSMMGWTEGSGVGANKGMSDPVGAKIKVSKGGLGF